MRNTLTVIPAIIKYLRHWVMFVFRFRLTINGLLFGVLISALAIFFIRPAIEVSKRRDLFSLGYRTTSHARPFWPQYWRYLRHIPEPDSAYAIIRSDDGGIAFFLILIFQVMTLFLLRYHRSLIILPQPSYVTLRRPSLLRMIAGTLLVTVLILYLNPAIAILLEEHWRLVTFTDIPFWPRYWRRLRGINEPEPGYNTSWLMVSDDGGWLLSGVLVVFLLLFCISLDFVISQKWCSSRQWSLNRLSLKNKIVFMCIINIFIYLWLQAISVNSENDWLELLGAPRRDWGASYLNRLLNRSDDPTL
jgi:hypothetical protein